MTMQSQRWYNNDATNTHYRNCHNSFTSSKMKLHGATLKNPQHLTPPLSVGKDSRQRKQGLLGLLGYCGYYDYYDEYVSKGYRYQFPE